MTYTYRCRDCDHEWEAEQRITDPPLTSCPACASPQGARRQINGTPAFYERHRPNWSGHRIRGKA